MPGGQISYGKKSFGKSATELKDVAKGSSGFTLLGYIISPDDRKYNKRHERVHGLPFLTFQIP